MKIIAVRHGETLYNKERRAMGQRIDASLTEEGREEIIDALGALKKEGPRALYSSPLKRAKETAEIISKELGLVVEFRDELMERAVGSLAGKTYREMAQAAKLSSVDDTKYDFTPFGGESSEQVRKRVTLFLKEVLEKYQDGKGAIIAVTHAHIIRILYKIYNEPLGEGEVDNVCVHPFS